MTSLRMVPRLLALSIMALPRLGGGCDCGPGQPPLKALARADAVFSGKVVSLEDKEVPLRGPLHHLAQGKQLSIEVFKSWKGKVAGTALVITGTGQGDCGFDFEVGKEYLIYARRGDDGRWINAECSRTSLLENTGDETLELEGRLPAPTLPARPPLLKFERKITEGNYHEYAFTLHNRLNQRIFYFAEIPMYLVQVMKGGKWVDYPQGNFHPPADDTQLHELSAADAAQRLADWKASYKTLASTYAIFVDRQGTASIPVSQTMVKTQWRVGLQYVTERELDSGKRIQNSKHCVWSDPIDATLP